MKTCCKAGVQAKPHAPGHQGLNPISAEVFLFTPHKYGIRPFPPAPGSMEHGCLFRCTSGALRHDGEPTAACPHTTRGVSLVLWEEQGLSQAHSNSHCMLGLGGSSKLLSSPSLRCSRAGHIRAGFPHTFSERKALCKPPRPPGFHRGSLLASYAGMAT